MKILLQQKHTGLVLAQHGGWAFEPKDAWEFNSASEAIRWCVSAGTWEVELVLRFHQNGESVDVPIQEASFSVSPHVARVHTSFQGQRTLTTQSMG